MTENEALKRLITDFSDLEGKTIKKAIYYEDALIFTDGTAAVFEII